MQVAGGHGYVSNWRAYLSFQNHLRLCTRVWMFFLFYHWPKCKSKQSRGGKSKNRIKLEIDEESGVSPWGLDWINRVGGG